ncbi:MAG: TIM-barrel domain-containing protein [Pleomorphochaeta sp.]
METLVKKERNSIYYKKQRITFLTDSLVRIEYSPKAEFIDEKTQMVINRDFDLVDISIIEKNGYLELYSSSLLVETNGLEFTNIGLKISLVQSEDLYYNSYRYGDEIDNLKGTARTLDEADGRIELEDGLLSKRGFSLIDDSSSMLFIDEFYSPRDKTHKDIYFFGYNHRYLQCLKDFYKLCGKQPMIPRYALGNWWSRYYKYTTKSYIDLLNRFEKEGIPFSVAVIDMDWHLVDIDKKYGSGWTGYTWNKELFPNPKAFLDELHKRSLKVTLNDHPADGVRAFEDNYNQIAKSLNVNNGQNVLFDASNPNYLKSLQTFILEPLENEGVDFWWIDWQQGNASRIEGLDPLWILNYTRFIANKKDNKRPLIFSRYGGVGSHRYPIGFSGDTHITWESLAFQPEFSASASNIGYGWWSHDIGGHMQGYKDNELMARWTQFGVFSPIMRLHSSNEMFNGKEPWRYNAETHKVMNYFLKLRHQLIPYLYTMNYIAHEQDIPLIRPMYYFNSEDEGAYINKNQYYFGSSMIVSPIVSKLIKNLLMSEVDIWLPKGKYYDFFTNRRYKGERNIKMYRPLSSIPVMVNEGSIIPLTENKNALHNPSSIYLKCYMGANGSFTLYEDDNISEKYKIGDNVFTEFINDFDNKEFKIGQSIGNLSLIPNLRDYKIEFIGIEDTDINVYNDNLEIDYIKTYDEINKIITIELNNVNVSSMTKIVFEKNKLVSISKRETYIEIIDRLEIEMRKKDKIFNILQSKDNSEIISNLISLDLDKALLNSLLEIILSE